MILYLFMFDVHAVKLAYYFKFKIQRIQGFNKYE